MSRIRFRNSKSGKPAGRAGALIFGLIWIAFSSIFVVLGIKSATSGVSQSQWPTEQCTITKLRIDSRRSNQPAFQPKVSFTYRWNGNKYTGSKVWLDKEGVNDFEDLSELIEAKRSNRPLTCYIDPESPADAILFLDKNSIWGGIIFAVFGAFFVLIGIGIILSPQSKKAAASNSKTSSSNKNKNEMGATMAISFFGIFGLAGLGILFFFVAPMWSKYLAAQDWQATDARVVWSTVRSHSGDDGTTYSVDIFYKYKFNGNRYQSNTVGLMGGSSSGRSSKQDIVNNHPAGKQFTCYVNPQSPHQAIIHRELGWWAAFSLFPLPFIAVGIFGLRYTFKNKKAKGNGSTANLASQQNSSAALHRPITFAPTRKRIGWLVGSICLAAFWNGIVSLFLLEAIDGWKRGHADWFLTLFLVPFVLAGLGFILHIFYRFLTCFNPSPTLTLYPGELTLGSPATLQWTIPSGEMKLQNFSIFLVGTEEATYSRGTDTTTDSSIFYEETLITTTDPRQAKRGEITINILADTMPSWQSAHNAIKWSLRIRAEIPRWPNVKDDYPITVHPPQSSPQT